MKKIFAGMYILLSSVTVLVMLVASFEQFNEKYMPAFLMGQKFALPVVLSILGVLYIFFFDPEALNKRSVRLGFFFAHCLVVMIFTVYLITLDQSKISGLTLFVFLLQAAALLGMTLQFLSAPGKKTD